MTNTELRRIIDFQKALGLEYAQLMTHRKTQPRGETIRVLGHRAKIYGIIFNKEGGYNVMFSAEVDKLEKYLNKLEKQ